MYSTSDYTCSYYYEYSYCIVYIHTKGDVQMKNRYEQR